MGSTNGVKDRRQERIRQIMERQAQASGTSGTGPQTDLSAPPIMLSELPYEKQPSVSPKPGIQPAAHADPERAWKERPSPWEEHASWSGVTKLREVDRRRDPEEGGNSHRPGALLRGFYIQTLIAAALFAMIYGAFHIEHPLAKKGQEVVTAALTDTYDFQTAAAWYEKTFAGAPSFIPLFQTKGNKDAVITEGQIELPVISPVSGGTVVRTFAETLSGLDIAVKPVDPVVAAETGRVTLVTDDAQSGTTVVIQHANDRVTIYGNLKSASVAVSDWVEAGQQIGKLQEAADNGTSLLFFAVKEKGKYVDPADVVPLD